MFLNSSSNPVTAFWMFHPSEILKLLLFARNETCQRWVFVILRWFADGWLVAEIHPLLCVELFGIVRTAIGPPQQIQQLLSSHTVHSNPCPAAGEEICERLIMLHFKSLNLTAVKAFGHLFHCCGAFSCTEGAAVGWPAFWRQKPTAEGAAVTFHRFLHLVEPHG